MMKLCLCVNSGEIPALAGTQWPQAHFLYRISPEGMLQRAVCSAGGGAVMILSLPGSAAFSAAALLRDVSCELANRPYGGVLLDCETDASDGTLALAGQLARRCGELGKTVTVDAKLRPACPGAAVLVSSAVTSGGYREYLQRAISQYGRLALLLRPLRADLSGAGSSRLTAEQLARAQAQPGAGSFFSQSLCAQYCHYGQGQSSHFLIWDTPRTLSQKLTLARSAGIKTAFALYGEVSHCLTELSLTLRGA